MIPRKRKYSFEVFQRLYMLFFKGGLKQKIYILRNKNKKSYIFTDKKYLNPKYILFRTCLTTFRFAGQHLKLNI